jgi:hypothetical protein
LAAWIYGIFKNKYLLQIPTDLLQARQMVVSVAIYNLERA